MKDETRVELNSAMDGILAKLIELRSKSVEVKKIRLDLRKLHDQLDEIEKCQTQTTGES